MYEADLTQVVGQERTTKSQIYFRKVISILKDYFS